MRHQFEQLFNAWYVQKMGYGRYTEKLSAADLAAFFARLPDYHRNLSGYPRQGNSALLAKLDTLVCELLPRASANAGAC